MLIAVILNPAAVTFCQLFFYTADVCANHLFRISLASESGDTANSACAPRRRRQHLGRIHQVPSDLLPESSGVCPSVPQPLPSVHPAARSDTFGPVIGSACERTLHNCHK